METTEIETTIMKCCPTQISSCLVMKASQNDDLLVAYIGSNDPELDIEEIRKYCRKYLHQYMIPSFFVVLDKLPLNINGKVDRKQLPLPKSFHLTHINILQSDSESMSELEKKVHDLWCATLRLDTVPHHMNCFVLGGSSLSLMQLFNTYQFHLVPDKQLNVLDFFVNPTIANHVQLLTNRKYKTNTNRHHPLHLVEGKFFVGVRFAYNHT